MNQLMESLVLGGFSYEVAFPFSRVTEKRKEKLLEELAGVLGTEALVLSAKILDEKGYGYYLKAIEVAEKRFLFYKNLLESEELRNKHLVILGTGDLTLRIVFAMHGCIEHSNKILCHIDNLAGDIIADSISAMEIGYNRWTILNLEEPITKCLMTGVCICEQGDIVPYNKGCVMSDPTRILISNEEKEKRSKNFYNAFVERIKKRR